MRRKPMSKEDFVEQVRVTLRKSEKAVPLGIQEGVITSEEYDLLTLARPVVGGAMIKLMSGDREGLVRMLKAQHEKGKE